MPTKASKKPVKKGAKVTTTAKAKQSPSLPGFFDFKNKNFVALLLVVLAAIGVGSYMLFKTEASPPQSRAYPTVRQCYHFKPTLRAGVANQRACTMTLQAFLNRARAAHPTRTAWRSLTVDGSFGQLTKSAVAEFQRAHGTPADGVVGRNTWAVINSDCSSHRNSSGMRSVCGL